MSLAAQILTFEGVPLWVDHPWEWAQLPGPFPYLGSFMLPRARANELWSLAGKPGVLHAQIQRDGPEGRKTDTIEWRNVYVIEPEYSSMGDVPVVKFTLADLRYKWRGLTVSGRFNYVRRLNDAQIAREGGDINVPGQQKIIGPDDVRQPDIEGGSANIAPDALVIAADGDNADDERIASFKPANVLAEFNVFPKFAYRKITLREGEEPWTALSLAVGILTGYKVWSPVSGLVEVPGILGSDEWGGLDGLTDNGFPLARLTYAGTPVTDALAYLLRLARGRLWVDPDGKVRIRPSDLTAPPKFPPQTRVASVGELYSKTFVAQRPAAVRVLFQIERELLFHTATESFSGLDNLVQNVIRLWKNITIDAGDGVAREYAAGTFLPIEPVLISQGIDSLFVRTHWFHDLLAIYVSTTGRDPATDTTPDDHAFIGAVMESFRQIFRVDERWQDRLLDLRPESVVVLDYLSGKRAPSPVWVDYMISRNFRVGPRVVATDLLLYENVRYDRTADDSSGEPAEDAMPGPFRVVVVDAEQGLIKIEPVTDQNGVIRRLVVGAVDDGADGKRLAAALAHDGGNLSEAALAEDFHIAAVVNALVCDPNTEAQYLAVDIAATDVGADPGMIPLYTVFVADETARYDRKGNLVNERMVRARADAEARMIYQSWQDRLCGMIGFGGLHEIKPVGPCKSVSWRSDGGFVTTVLDYNEPRQPKAIEQLLPPDLRNQRLKLLPPQT